MARKSTYEELEQRVKKLEKEVQDLKGVEDALKDYIAFKSVLAILRGVGPEQPEERLFQTFLSEIVKQYGFCMSWYGQYSNGEIKPILSAGRVDRYLDNLVLEIKEPTSPDAKCAMSQAILRGAPFTYADLERDEGFRQWRDYALELGYRSNLALPLEVDSQVAGGFMVYADTPNAFPEERIERLQLLSSEISAILNERRIRQKAEKALRKSEQMYRSLVETSHDIIFIVDLKGNFLFTNKAFESILGYSHEDAKGINGFDLVHPEDLDSARERFDGLIEGKRENNIEYRYRTKDGSYIHMLNNASPIFDSEGNVAAAFGIARDISELKQAEEALQRARDELEIRVEDRTAELSRSNALLKQEVAERKRADEAVRGSEEKYRTLFDSAADLIAVIDTEGKILDLNKMFEEESGYSQEEMVGKNVFSSGIITKESGDRALFHLNRLLHGEELPTFEVDGVKKDGGLVPYELRAAPIKKDETVVGVQAVLRNISERKQAEEEKKRLEAQLVQAQKMESIGTLAGGVAHDFNNLLMGIQGNVSLMFLNMDSTHPYYERLKSVEKQVQSGARLTSHLLGYARKGKYEVKPVDLNQMLKEVSETFGRTRKDVTIHRELAEDLLAIEADSGQIEQVLLNLFVNAADAMPGGGNLILKTINVTHKDMTGKLYNPKPGKYVQLTVTDTGGGMDKETMERIFDPFFTTKEMGRGTGLGLASAYGIIKGHAGYIDVDSKKGHGTSFSIYLPASKRKVQEAVKAAEPLIKGTGTVLLVDDEEVIVEVGKELLEGMGYRVLTAKDGKEAIEVYKKERDEIDIVILDIVMPKMGGGEAYDRMKEINPDIKVLLSSGFSIDGEASEILERGCNGFIQKPFNMMELSGKIGEILDKK